MNNDHSCSVERGNPLATSLQEDGSGDDAEGESAEAGDKLVGSSGDNNDGRAPGAGSGWGRRTIGSGTSGTSSGTSSRTISRLGASGSGARSSLVVGRSGQGSGILVAVGRDGEDTGIAVVVATRGRHSSGFSVVTRSGHGSGVGAGRRLNRGGAGGERARRGGLGAVVLTGLDDLALVALALPLLVAFLLGAGLENARLVLADVLLVALITVALLDLADVAVAGDLLLVPVGALDNDLALARDALDLAATVPSVACIGAPDTVLPHQALPAVGAEAREVVAAEVTVGDELLVAVQAEARHAEALAVEARVGGGGRGDSGGSSDDAGTSGYGDGDGSGHGDDGATANVDGEADVGREDLALVLEDGNGTSTAALSGVAGAREVALCLGPVGLVHVVDYITAEAVVAEETGVALADRAAGGDTAVNGHGLRRQGQGEAREAGRGTVAAEEAVAADVGRVGSDRGGGRGRAGPAGGGG